jgi:hypothetical protein
MTKHFPSRGPRQGKMRGEARAGLNCGMIKPDHVLLMRRPAAVQQLRARMRCDRDRHTLQVLGLLSCCDYHVGKGTI